MSETTLRTERTGAVARLVLARPGKLNALTANLHAELRSALESLAADDQVRVVVLTGEGRAFSAGQDLTETLPRDERGRVDLGPPLARDYNPLILRLVDFPKVTIAALNGPAVGASMNIALACDIVLAARSAYLQEAFVHIGLIPDAGGTWLLPRIVGPRLASALMLTGDRIPAEEAKSMGLVYRVFEDAEFESGVADFARVLSEGPALAHRMTKRALRESLGNELETQLDLEASLQREAGFSMDFVEGLQAFREKRPPRFAGR